MFINVKKKNGLFKVGLSIIVVIIVIFSLQYIGNKQPMKVNTLDYFIQGTTIEASGLPWGSEPSEAMKYFGKMDESYERYLSYMQRQIPIRQIYFKELELRTDGIGVFYTVDGKLNNVIYIFRYATEEESIKAHTTLLNYFIESLPDFLKYKEVDNGVLVKNQNGELVSNPQYLWEDEAGNTLRLVNDSYSDDSPSVEISISSKKE